MITKDPKALRRYMVAADCTQARLARNVGVTRQFVHQLVSGQVPGCRDDVARKIEVYLGVLPGTLFVPGKSHGTGDRVT